MYFWATILQKCWHALLNAWDQGYVMLICLITGEVTFLHLVKMGSTDSSTVDVTIFLLEWISVLWEIPSDYANILFLIIHLPSNFSIHGCKTVPTK